MNDLRLAPTRCGALLAAVDRAACTAAILVCALALLSCVHPAPIAPPGRPAPVELLTDVTYVASLVHWIDSLAGTSGGKTIPTYRRLWEDRYGNTTPEDLAALRTFRQARDSPTGRALCRSPFPGSVSSPPGWRSYFLYAALEARDVDGFLGLVRPCLAEDELRGLDRAIGHFKPGFDSFWREGTYLARFDEGFQEFLQQSALRIYLSEVARFFGVDPSIEPAPILSFVLLPRSGSTHAQAIGRRLLIEVRPLDTPRDQVQVVAHEESHYLFEMIPPARLAALAGRAREASPHGARAWELMQEALPTALGQGLATARLTPGDFSERLRWYHIAEIDTLAHAIYPIVRREVGAGHTIDGPFIEECVRAYEETLGKQGSEESGDRPSPDAPWER